MFSNAYISVNTIFEYHLSNSVHTQLVGDEGPFKMRTAAYRGRGCHASCLPTHLFMFTYLNSCLWQHFCLIASYFICKNLTLRLFTKVVFDRHGYFSPTK